MAFAAARSAVRITAHRDEQPVDRLPGRLAGRRGQPRIVPQRPQVDGLAAVGGAVRARDHEDQLVTDQVVAGQHGSLATDISACAYGYGRQKLEQVPGCHADNRLVRRSRS
jgi:hypothetical protein